MKSIHFFTEIGPNLQQAVDQNFGPVSTSKFNVSSMHSWTGSNNPKAFAALTGQIVYQKDLSSTDTNLLNAILKISDPKGLNDLPLKYIIYRGILESSILQSDQRSFLPIQDENHIVKQILEQEFPSNQNYLSLELGIRAEMPTEVDEIFLSSDAELERLFQSSNSKSSWEVKAGTVLGEFQTTAFGIDAIQESGWKRPQVKILREPLISEGNTVEIILPASAAEIKAEKEAILNYIDPACLYSLFYTKGIQTILHEEPRKMQQVYDDILVSFLNRNRVYLDIRNHNDFSLNFYGDNTNISFKDSSENPQNRPYEYSNWPVHIINDENIKKPIGDKKTEIPLALPTGSNTLNTCFLVHAALCEKEVNGGLNKYPKYQNGGAKFIELRADRDQTDRTTFFSLSTFKDASNSEIVCAYFRLFYAKQWEEQGSNAPAPLANDIMDNIFIAENIANYTERLEGASMRHWLTGRMMYIPRKLSNGVRSYIDYPGMYYAGIAIDNFSITFYAIPFAVNSRRKGIVPPVALPESTEAGFLQTLVSGGSGDFKMDKFPVTDPEEGSVQILNIYNRSADPQTKKFDEEAFVGLSLTRIQYIANISDQLSAFADNLHPIFLKVNNNSYMDFGQVTRKELVLVGYNNLAELKTENISNTYFYFLGKKMGRFGHTAAVAIEIQFAEQIAGIPTGFEIGHDQNDPLEREKFAEIGMALKLVKSFMKEEFDEVVRLLGQERVDQIPIFKVVGPAVSGTGNAGANKVFDRCEAKPRKYSIKIEYGDLGADIDGETTVDLLNALLFDEGQNTNATVGGNNDIVSVLSQDNVNKNDYEFWAVQNMNSTPKQIEQNYTPHIRIRREDPSNPGTTKDSELLVYNEIPGAERAIYENNIIITLNKNLRTQLSSDELTFETETLLSVYPENFKGEFAGLSELLVRLSSIIAHELGHIVALIKFPVLVTAWGRLEKKYTKSPVIQPNHPTQPSFRAEGHLEGNPEGNLTGRYEYKFSKTLVQDGLWPAAIPIISRATINGVIINKKIMKLKDNLTPYYLEIIEDEPVAVGHLSFKIRNYINGNLGIDEVELPPTTTLSP